MDSARQKKRKRGRNEEVIDVTPELPVEPSPFLVVDHLPTSRLEQPTCPGVDHNQT
jgi:hypothetical protein